MDASGYLRPLVEEDDITMEDIVDPVSCKADLPNYKRALFETIDEAGNRKFRKKMCKHLKVDWSQYQIYSKLK